MSDSEAARLHMVESQLRPNKVSDPRLLDTFQTLPRELFVPEPRRSIAYVDDDVPIGNGRFLTEPMILARLVQLALEPEVARLVAGVLVVLLGLAVIVRVVRRIRAGAAASDAAAADIIAEEAEHR